MAKVLITGGSGFLGMNIIPELLKNGYEVTNLSLNAVHWDEVENIIFNALEDSLETTLKDRDFDFVIHLIALSTPKIASDQEKTMAINVELTEKLLQLAKNFPSLKGFFFPSTALVYADDAPRPLKPGAPLEAHEDDFYTQSKIKAEAVCKKFHDQGMPVHIWRLTNGFGPHQPHKPHPNLIPQVMKQAIEEKKVTILNGSYTRDFLFSRDLARMLVQALPFKDDYFILNVATGTPHSVAEIAEVIAQELDSPIEDLKKDLSKAKDLTLDISKLKKLFPNFKYTPFDEALRESLAYYIHVV